MNSLILIPLCLVTWIFTLLRLRTTFFAQDVQKAKKEMALNVWAMLLFFSITLTFMVDTFAAFFNIHTFSNFSILITHIAFLASQYFATVATLNAIEIPSSQRTIRWIRYALGILIITLLVIYILFISKMPAILSDSPQIFRLSFLNSFHIPLGSCYALFLPLLI